MWNKSNNRISDNLKWHLENDNLQKFYKALFEADEEIKAEKVKKEVAKKKRSTKKIICTILWAIFFIIAIISFFLLSEYHMKFGIWTYKCTTPDFCSITDRIGIIPVWELILCIILLLLGMGLMKFDDKEKNKE